MECLAPMSWSEGSYSPPSSSRSSSTSSGCGSFGQGSEMSDDVFGLKGLMSNYYIPALESEFERLFFPAERGRGFGRGSPDSLDSPQINAKSVWEDFNTNGQEAQLDDLDRLFRGLDAGDIIHCHQTAPHSQPPSPTPMSVAEFVQCGGGMGGRAEGGGMVQDILTKAHLIDILREREQLQRSARNIKRVVTVGSTGVTSTNKAKSQTGKVCVFCRNNGEAEAVYSSHQLKDPEGNVTCPILYIYTCPICGANGKQSHTIKYCPYNTGDALSLKSITKTPRTSTGKRIGLVI